METRYVTTRKNLQELFLMRTQGIISRENYWENFENTLRHLQDLASFIQEKQLKISIDSNKKMGGGVFLEIDYFNLKSPIIMRLIVDDKRSVPYLVLADGPYEEFQAKVTKKLMEEATVFADVGSNMGFYALLCAIINNKSRIYAFEPNLKVSMLLGDNVSKNKLSNQITICQFALGDNSSKNRIMYIPKFTGTAGASLKNLHPEEGTSKKIKVQMETLDRYFMNKSKSIDLIKIDVEGSEMNVLHGGTQLIKRDKPTVIIELLRKWMKPFGSHPQFAVEFFLRQGYIGYSIGKECLKLIEKIDEYTEETNFIFVHKDNAKHLKSLHQFVV